MRNILQVLALAATVIGAAACERAVTSANAAEPTDGHAQSFGQSTSSAGTDAPIWSVGNDPGYFTNITGEDITFYDSITYGFARARIAMQANNNMSITSERDLTLSADSAIVLHANKLRFVFADGNKLEFTSTGTAVRITGTAGTQSTSIEFQNIGRIKTTAIDTEIGGNGIGFYGAVPAAKPNILGSRGSGVALTNLLAQLHGQGLITNNTQP